MAVFCSPFLFFFNDTATTEIYTLSLHDALPIWSRKKRGRCCRWYKRPRRRVRQPRRRRRAGDRKSTRLNSSHDQISYAVFCLKKKKIDEPISDNLKAHTVHTRADTTLAADALER